MVEHIESCDLREITCEKCGIKFGAKEKANHDKDKCEMRMVNCDYCGITMKSKDLNIIHLNPDRDELCSKYVGICSNNCNETRKVNLKDHLKICPNKKLECPFHQFDCKIDKMTKEKLMKHLDEEYFNHTSSLINKVKDLESKIIDLESELHNQILITKELFEMNKKSSESRLKIEKTIEELKKKAPATSIQTIDNKNVIFRNASFIWKFTDFEVRRVDAESGGRVSVTSDAFYTSEFGYKMCLRVYPAGDGVGKGTHLSVFFAIMKGEFDDLLSWPFKQKVTLSILDQESGSKPHSDTFKPDARSACYQKPTDECNIASGFPKFILLSLIMNNSIYCKNDTIFLKIAVDTMGIFKP
uniref:TNF receptor-associated factor-2-like protein A n=1 Tax=Dugesia japonica TaxID=6161 RepID=D5JG59_DUGJA|nr:TNF receptor-associated factor-2-like protein A [Dugesia japonica]